MRGHKNVSVSVFSEAVTVSFLIDYYAQLRPFYRFASSFWDLRAGENYAG